MIKPKWNSEAVKAYETGQGVELVNEPYLHYVPLTTESEKQEQGEPVGWIDSKGYMICVKTDESCRPLYTTPQRTWVGLTAEDADSIECWFREEIENDRFSVQNLISRIEAKLKDKNI